MAQQIQQAPRTRARRESSAAALVLATAAASVLIAQLLADGGAPLAVSVAAAVTTFAGVLGAWTTLRVSR
jgi:hypothetical protein